MGWPRNLGSRDGWAGLTHQQQVDLLALHRVQNTAEKTTRSDTPGDQAVANGISDWQRRVSSGN